MNSLLGILGGTFNPIHFGHLRMAEEVAEKLQLDQVKFIPSANPPHKDMPDVSAFHRSEMVRLAITDNPKFLLDTRELERIGHSYTIDTLKSLRTDVSSNTNLCLLIGCDAFSQLDTWHDWKHLLNYCHIIMVDRPMRANNLVLNSTLDEYLKTHYTNHLSDLKRVNNGLISKVEISQLDISSTDIRQRIKQNSSIRYLLPDTVHQYMIDHSLYL